MSTTRAHRHIRAPRSAVYAALLDARAVRQWRVPDGMTSEVHSFDAREGGAFRVSLTYEGAGAGKSTAKTDTYHGRFVKLVPNEKIVEIVEFESTDPALQGEMTITYILTEADGETDLDAIHDNVPAIIPPADNLLGWRMSLAKLAALVEAKS